MLKIRDTVRLYPAVGSEFLLGSSIAVAIQIDQTMATCVQGQLAPSQVLSL